MGPPQKGTKRKEQQNNQQQIPPGTGLESVHIIIQQRICMHSAHVLRFTGDEFKSYNLSCLVEKNSSQLLPTSLKPNCSERVQNCNGEM